MNRGSRYRSRRNFSSSRGRSNGGSSGYHRRNTSTNNAKAAARGVFADGVWHCDCTPRLPAEHFKVKKEGTNKGRWFYTCQLDADKRCGFFLWDEEAKPREAAAVLGNSRSEPGAGAQRQTEQLAQPVTPAKESRPSRSTNLPAGKGMFSGTGRRVSPVRLDSPTSSPSPVRDTRGPGKRSARSAGMDDTDDDDFGWALDGPEESELARIADEADTPRKAIKTGVYATPATTTTKKSPRKLPWLDDEPTSPTPARRGAELKTPSFTRNVDEPVTPTTTRTRKSVLDYFAPPVKSGSLSPTSTITDESAETRPEYVQDSYPPVDATALATRPRVHFMPLNEPSTPPSENFSLAKLQESECSKSHQPLNPTTTPKTQIATTPTTPSLPPLTTTILPLLTAIPESSLTKIHSLLATHDLRVQGIVMGREIARAAVKAREQRIVELEDELRQAKELRSL